MQRVRIEWRSHDDAYLIDSAVVEVTDSTEFSFKDLADAFYQFDEIAFVGAGDNVRIVVAD